LRQGVFRTNPEDVKNAGQQGNPGMTMAQKGKCLTQYVQSVEKKQKCLSSRAWISLFIAASVFPNAISYKDRI
jgi:hypothetical protein